MATTCCSKCCILLAVIEGGQSVAGQEQWSDQCSRLGPHQTSRLPFEGSLTACTERENSELYYTGIDILGICLVLQSVLANLHANT